MRIAKVAGIAAFFVALFAGPASASGHTDGFGWDAPKPTVAVASSDSPQPGASTDGFGWDTTHP